MTVDMNTAGMLPGEATRDDEVAEKDGRLLPRRRGGRVEAIARPRRTSSTSTVTPKSDVIARVGSTSKRTVETRSDIVLKKLRLVRGVTVVQIMEATGWQAHTVRGFLSAVVRKRLKLDLTSETGKDGHRRYRIVEHNAEAA